MFDGILNRTPPPIAQLNPRLPAEIGAIVSKALEKDPDLRYQSIGELRTDLRRVQRGAPSPRIDGIARVFVTRRLRSPVAAWTVAAALGGWILWSAVRPARAPAGAPAATLTQVTRQLGVDAFPSLSIDGRTIIFASAGDI